MKTIRLLACAIFVSFLLISNAIAQTTARGLTKKITDANAAANQDLNRSLTEPPPAAPAPSKTIKPSPQAVTNVVPEKTAEQKVAILQKTIEFQKKRAEAGAPTAQYDLGIRYLNGDGVEKNPELAKKWLHSAATNGNTQAVKKLGELKKQ